MSHLASGYDRITPDGKKFYKEIAELARLKLHVGFQHGETEDNSAADIADIAMWNELGTSNIPPRPFIRQSVDNNASRITAMCKTQLQGIAKGTGTAQSAYESIGVMQKGLIQNEILNGGFTPNAPATIKRKGSAQPLIDTGKMRQSVTFETVEG